jgi:hypothetical protein
MAFTPVENSVTLSTTEKSVTNNTTTLAATTTDAIVQLFLDVSAMATGNETKIRLYEKAISGGTQRIVAEWTLVGVQSLPIWVSPAFCLCNGWDFGLTGVSGTPVIPASIRPVALV